MLERLLVTASFLISCAGGASLTPPGPVGSYRVLFIGNSLTYTNDLPTTVAQLGANVHDTMVVESVTRPNFAVIDHVNGMSNAVDVVRRGHWDFVVLQQGPTSQALGRDTLIIATRRLEPDIRAAGGRSAQLMTWPAANRHQDFEGALRSCREAASAVGGLCFPAGEAWRVARTLDPSLPLYGPDGFHPSPLGTYLAALVVYEGITGQDVRWLPRQAVVAGRPLDLSARTVALLQRVAHETVSRWRSAAGNY